MATHADPDLSAPYFVECLQGIRRVFSVGIAVNPPPGAIDGWILLAPDKKQLAAAIRRGAPTVVVNGMDRRFPSIDVDNAAAAQAVTRQLLLREHRRPAFIGGKRESLNARERKTGFRRALAEAGLSWNPHFFWEGRFDRESGARAVDHFWKRRKPPTAIFAANDHMALGAWEALRRRGARVPQDVALAGFDDISDARRAGLTSVRQPLASMAERAAKWLKTWLGTGSPPRVQGVRVDGRLVIRSSSGGRGLAQPKKTPHGRS